MKNNKFILYFAIGLICFGIFQILSIFIPDSYYKYILNYQVFLFLIGIYLIVKTGISNMGGIWLIVIAIYLYLKEYVNYPLAQYLNPALLIVLGIILIFVYNRKRD